MVQETRPLLIGCVYFSEMGLQLAKFWDWWATRTDKLAIVMVGLDAAGKTTILYRLRLGEVVNTVPTIGFNVETVQYGNKTFTVWDVGGQEQIRRLWRHYYQGADGIIFVVDSNDRERLANVKEELTFMLKEEDLRNAVVLIFANKQDLPNAMKVQEISDGLALHELGDRKWYIQPACATTGDGLFEGLEWLRNTLDSLKK